MPLVSVVIPCYNSEKYIEETVKSVLNQSYDHLEIICVNNKSTDNSLMLLNELAKFDHRIKVYNEDHAGANFARNTGLKKTTGKYIQFLDADDVIVKDKIYLQVKQLEDTKSDIVISDRAVFDETLSLALETFYFSSIVQQPLYESVEKIIITGNPLYRTELVKSIGGYLEELISAQDWEFHIRLFLSKPKVTYLPGVFLHSRQVSNSLSSNYISVSHNACKVITMYRDQLLENGVNQHNGATKKILFTYLISYVHSGIIEYRDEFILWYRESKQKRIFSKFNQIIILIFGPYLFLKMKRALFKLKSLGSGK